jgi:kynurenine formamidase
MPVLDELISAIRAATIEVIDLTSPLEATTPVIRLPEPFGNTKSFALHEISRYDERGPAWYWNDITTGEHTGTHFDAPVHWVTGRDGEDVAQVPVTRLIAPAVVLDFSAEAAADPDFLLEIEHVKKWEAEHGALPNGGWLLYRTGWDARSHSQEEFLNANETGPESRSSARNGWRTRPRCSGSGRRPSAPMPGPRTHSTRRSPATPRCSVRASTASPSCRTWPGCRPPARWS